MSQLVMKGEPAGRTERSIIRPIRPATDVVERANDWILVLDVPGADESALSVEVEDRELRVSAPLASRSLEGERIVQRERPQGVYVRSFRLGDDADPHSIEAELRHGLLSLRIAKAEPVKPRRIDVRVASATLTEPSIVGTPPQRLSHDDASTVISARPAVDSDAAQSGS